MSDLDEQELERDVLAIETFVRLYPSEVPSLDVLRVRLARTPRSSKRERIVRGTYLAVVEGL